AHHPAEHGPDEDTRHQEAKVRRAPGHATVFPVAAVRRTLLKAARPRQRIVRDEQRQGDKEPGFGPHRAAISSWRVAEPTVSWSGIWHTRHESAAAARA